MTDVSDAERKRIYNDGKGIPYRDHVSDAAPDNEELLRLAEKHPPPDEWYEDEDVTLIVDPAAVRFVFRDVIEDLGLN